MLSAVVMLLVSEAAPACCAPGCVGYEARPAELSPEATYDSCLWLLSGLPPHVVTEAPELGFDLATLRRLVGGLELGLSLGAARVSSGVVDEAGEAYEVASGDAVSQGLSVSLYSAPAASGLFARPSVGLSSEVVDISDFRADLPGSRVPDALEVGGVCRDASSGHPVDCDAPNIYRLELTSLHAGLRSGAALVVANRYATGFVELALAMRAAEYRLVHASVSAQRSVRSGVELFGSGGADAMVGLAVPALHLAVKLSLAYSVFPNITFERPLTFLGRVRYDEERQVYARPVVRVDDARFDTWGLQASVAVTL